MQAGARPELTAHERFSSCTARTAQRTRRRSSHSYCGMPMWFGSGSWLISPMAPSRRPVPWSLYDHRRFTVALKFGTRRDVTKISHVG